MRPSQRTSSRYRVQNSNIRSYALSLGQQRKTTAQCQDVLTTLQETVQQSMAYKATR